MRLTIAAEVADFVRPEWFVADAVIVREADPRLDEALGAAADALRRDPPSPEVTAGVRAMYRAAGIDPTKTRPSSEALLRRVQRGDPLPRVNSLVDIINWCSVETALPFGLYDAASIRGPVTLRLGRPGECVRGHSEGRGPRRRPVGARR